MIAKIDAHHHLFARDLTQYPMLVQPSVERFYGDTEHLKREFGPAQYIALARAHNVVKSVYVESGFHQPVQETAYAQSIADQYGFPQAIIAKGDLESPSIAADLEVHMRSANFRGVRVCLNWDTDSRRASAPRAGVAREPRWRAGYGELAKRSLTADIMILPGQFDDLAAIAADFPQVQIILNHAGLPFSDGPEGLRPWSDGMRRLARCPNIAVKISGLGMVDHHWTVDTIRGLVTTTIDVFGTDRCLFASNFPIDGMYSSYGALFDAFEDITGALPQSERVKLFHDNAARIYRI
jgi:predicted TIM-barrel fold metal-dependent hydrolase